MYKSNNISKIQVYTNVLPCCCILQWNTKVLISGDEKWKTHSLLQVAAALPRKYAASPSHDASSLLSRPPLITFDQHGEWTAAVHSANILNKYVYEFRQIMISTRVLCYNDKPSAYQGEGGCLT